MEQRDRKEWKFFAVLPRADRTLALVWWGLLALRGVLPAFFALAAALDLDGLHRRRRARRLAWLEARTKS